jgi:ribonuclease III
MVLEVMDPLVREDIAPFLTKYGIAADVMKDMSLYNRAFMHRSACHIARDSNETLEYLGDAVLGLSVAQYLCKRFDTEQEGFLTEMRIKMINGVMLADLCQKIGLQSLLATQEAGNAFNALKATDVVGDSSIGIGSIRGGPCTKNAQEDLLEAFVGALFQDTGYDVVNQWLINMYESEVDFVSLVLENNNYKQKLSKHFMTEFSCSPTFVQEASVHGTKVVTVKNAANTVIGTGRGSTVKKAENEAALNALKYIGVNV